MSKNKTYMDREYTKFLLSVKKAVQHASFILNNVVSEKDYKVWKKIVIYLGDLYRK